MAILKMWLSQVTVNGRYPEATVGAPPPSITSGGNGANVTFSVEKNMELQPRNTSFTFTLGNEKATLHVTQEAAPNSNISLNPESSTVSSNSNTQSVIVTCNGTWALSGETVSWCYLHYNKSSKKVQGFFPHISDKFLYRFWEFYLKYPLRYDIT